LLVTPANESPRLGVYHMLKIPEKGTVVEFDVLQRGLENLQVAFQTRKSAETQTVDRHSFHVHAVPENTWHHVRCVVAEATPAQGSTGSAKGLFLQHVEIHGRRKEGSKEPCLMLDNVVVREAP
jgi:Cu/Zn superoxide dismutase